MRKGLGLLALSVALALPGCVAVPVQQEYAVTTSSSGVSMGVFYETLSPYGEWVFVPGYGRVWRPSPAVVGWSFRPYVTGGRWVYTDYGWSFESDWDWGWAPFHYGRWMLDAGYGWVWVPDTVWGPAWVEWRYGGGYVGWAPLPPPGAVMVYSSYEPWYFVETRYFVARDFYRYSVPRERMHVAFGVTYTLNDRVTYGGRPWYAGPPASHVATAIGQPIRPSRLASPGAPPPGWGAPSSAPPRGWGARSVPGGTPPPPGWGGRPPAPGVAPAPPPGGRVPGGGRAPGTPHRTPPTDAYMPPAPGGGRAHPGAPPLRSPGDNPHVERAHRNGER